MLPVKSVSNKDTIILSHIICFTCYGRMPADHMPAGERSREPIPALVVTSRARGNIAQRKVEQALRQQYEHYHCLAIGCFLMIYEVKTYFQLCLSDIIFESSFKWHKGHSNVTSVLQASGTSGTRIVCIVPYGRSCIDCTWPLIPGCGAI